MMKKGFLRPRPAGGFAIIITVSILVLLAVVAVGLLTLSTVTLRTSQSGAAQAEARANAKLALMLALGDLQKAMGPDQRISSRAEGMGNDSRLGIDVGSGSPKSWWVGASHSDPDEEIGPNGQSIMWLVSGLDRSANAKSQISGGDSFDDPVDLYGDGSIDTSTLTGGQPIQAGNVTVENALGQESGGFAYFIDDNGMKAQLAASDPEMRNDSSKPPGGGVLPGTYELDILEEMESLSGIPEEEYLKLNSLRDLLLIGADRAVARDKHFSYTTRSWGVLSDVRKGGLKRDLTIAFENDGVFDKVFGNRGRGFSETYVVMDSEKFRQSSELSRNGYIHWDIFKDYYNIKKYILKEGRAETIDPVLFLKDGIFSNNNTPFGRGAMGPHAIGPNNSVPGNHQQMPYGDYSVLSSGAGKNAQHFKHSPIIPILSRMQQNAWIELEPGATPRSPSKLKTNVQLWASHYNPYNITLKLVGDNTRSGPRILTYPQVRFTVPGMITNKEGLGSKRQSHVPHPVLIAPGRSTVCAFKNDGQVGAENDVGLYESNVKDLTLESVYSLTDVSRVPTGQVAVKVDFYLLQPSMSHGADHQAGSYELSQVMWAPFAWDAVDRLYPGKSITKSVHISELNDNNIISHSLHLRTTRETGSSIRPLIDANIRALFCNTKWDAPLGVDLLAGYSAEGQGETEEPFFPMSTVDQPSGYSYWGAGRDPVDGSDRVILFDIPREDLVSLGQLQHAGAGRFSYEPTYIVANSYANPRIPLDAWTASLRDTFSTARRGLAQWKIPGPFKVYDASYLVNEELWDSYIFTTLPQSADNYRNRVSPDLPPTANTYTRLIDGDAFLPNPRFLPYEPQGSSFDGGTLRDLGDAAGSGSFYHNAGHLLVDGAFNVNSTSVDAWEAFLSGTHKLPYHKMNGSGVVSGFAQAQSVEGVRFPRVKSVYGEPMESGSLDENYWTGFRELEQKEVRELAEAIVDEVRERGPFLTLGEFVNRKLEGGEHGQRGALQAALDNTVNAGLDNSFEEAATHPNVPSDSTQGAGFPGQLLQGDVLQALSPYMTVRSDSFTIRAYGESRAVGSGDVQARAWCEATVQRVPDPLETVKSGQGVLQDLANPASPFGRSLRVVSFRWLSPEEI